MSNPNSDSEKFINADNVSMTLSQVKRFKNVSMYDTLVSLGARNPKHSRLIDKFNDYSNRQFRIDNFNFLFSLDDMTQNEILSFVFSSDLKFKRDL